MTKSKKIIVEGIRISVMSKEDKDYLSLTDMLRAKDGDFFISNQLRNRNTVEFLGIWKRINNPNFNYGEFTIIKSQTGLNNYKISVKEWVKKTNAIGLRATAGRYGGTYAHKDIAFEFGMWISPQFITKTQANIIYSSEADILNMALFGMTAGDWREKNKGKEGNIRDYCDISQLVVLANLEGINAELIRQKLSQDVRLFKLNEIAIYQMKALIENPSIKKLKVFP